MLQPSGRSQLEKSIGGGVGNGVEVEAATGVSNATKTNRVEPGAAVASAAANPGWGSYGGTKTPSLDEESGT